MPFPQRLLTDDEELVLDLRPHWWYMAEPTAALIGSIIVGILVHTKAGDDGVGTVLRFAAIGLIVFCLLWFGIRYARWVTTNFVVTSDRVVFRVGVLSKKGVEIPLERINTVFFNQTIFERMLGAGDVAIESGGETGKESFSDIRKPSLVQNEIYRQMEANNTRMYRGAGGQSAPAAPDITQQIDRLDDLRRRGVITDAEFNEKKADLLKRL